MFCDDHIYIEQLLAKFKSLATIPIAFIATITIPIYKGILIRIVKIILEMILNISSPKKVTTKNVTRRRGDNINVHPSA